VRRDAYGLDGARSVESTASPTRRGETATVTAVTAKSKGLIKPLTGLRFAAALLVVLLHTFHVDTAAGAGPGPALRHGLANLVARGFVGVPFFFILSGFILTYAYVDKQRRDPEGAAVDRRAFWIARFARIYPVYLFALVVAAVPMVYWSGPNGGCTTNHPIISKITTPLLLQSWVPCAQWTWNGPSWSLSVEAFFYLLFPFVAVPIGRLGRRGLYGVMTFALVAYALIIALYCVVNPGGENPLTMPRTVLLNTLTLNPLVHLPEFVVGVALGGLFARRRSDMPRARARLARFLSPGPLSTLATIAIVGLLATGIVPTVQLVADLLLTPLFAALIYTVAYNEGPIAAFFSLPPLLILGEASYALYLLHQPIWNWMDHLAPRLPLTGSVRSIGLYFPVFLCIALGASLITLRAIERPARAAITRAFARRTRSRTSARGSI